MKIFFFSLTVLMVVGAYLWHSKRSGWSVTIVSMIRNEEAAMLRFLASARQMTANVMFCDTGSTDATLQLIRGYPVFHHNWTDDFSKNRNLCLKSVLPHIKTDYVLLLDADHTIEPLDVRKRPEYDMNMIRMRGNYLPYLIRTRRLRSCAYRGVTHEFLDCGDGVRSGHYDGFSLNHHEDGSHRAEKYEKDRARLEKGYKQESDPHLRIRYGFYLARTYEALKLWDKAIEWYEKRAHWEGWKQEVWFSKYRRAFCMLYSKNYTSKQVDEAFMEAYRDDPHRKEPLYYLALMHRERQDFASCLLYGRAGLLIGSPDAYALFVDQDVYEWQLEEEVAMCLWYSGRKEEARGHWKRVYNNPYVSEEVHERMENNLMMW